MYKEGTLKFWWTNSKGSYEVLVPDVATALELYRFNVERDLSDDSISMNLGGLEVSEMVDGQLDWYEYEDLQGRTIEDLFDETFEEN